MKNAYLIRLLALALTLGAALSSAQAQFEVTAPASVAGTYNVGIAVFGPLEGGFSGLVVPVLDSDGGTFACTPIVNTAEIAGNIALIDRGVCGFAPKALEAQAAGAIGVIICNNDLANPDLPLRMGGTDNCALTIPTVGMSYNDCQTLRVETGLTVSLNSPVGASIGDAIDIGEGDFTVGGIFGIENIFVGATASQYYRYEATAQGLLNISSCGSGVDTRLIVITASGACRAELFATVAFVAASTNACDNPDATDFGSDLNLLVNEGDVYYLIWDNNRTNAGFDFSVSLLSLPTLDVTFNVDMSTSVVSGDGVQMVYAGPGATSLDDVTVVNMADPDGDGIWSVTIPLTTLDTIGYAFVNGNVLAGGEIEDVPEECGIDGGFGFNVRPLIVQGLVDYTAGSFCFSSCSEFCALDCADPLVLIFDDFESYTAGEQPTGVPYIIVWPGTTSLGLISDLFAFSGNNSHRITGTGADVDPVYVLGNQTSGQYIVSWRMYVPEGNSAYYNFQKSHTPPGTQWAFQLHFDPDGVARLEAGSANAANPRARFNYAPNTWLNIRHIIDLDNNIASLFFNNQHISSWPYNWQPFAQTGTLQLGGVNFYPSNPSFVYYIDDFYFARIPDAADGLYCQAATEIAPGVHGVEDFTCFGGGFNVRANGVNGARAAWFTYTPDEDGWISVSSCGSDSDTRVWVFTGDCYELTRVGVNDDRCEQSNGDPYASYREVVVTAGTTYYIMWDNVWDNAGFEFELAFSTDDLVPGNFCQSAIPVTPGVYTVESFGDASVAGPMVGFLTSSTTPYAGGAWYSYTPSTSGRVNINSCLGDNTDTYVFVYTGSCDNFNTLQRIVSNDDSCGASSEVEFDAEEGTTYYIEWIDRFSDAPFDWELRQLLPGDICADAFDINSLFGGGLGNTVISGSYDNTDYTVTDADPDFGWECFGEPDGSGSAPSLERTMWFAFVGDGQTYLIEARGCGDNPIPSDDTQMAIYSGDCEELVAEACNDDFDINANLFYASIEFETEEGVTYYIMVDGFGPNFEAFGEFCIEVTQQTAALVTVTFQVDAQVLVQSGDLHPEGMFVAGSFSDFQNVAMSDPDGDNVWTVEIAVNPGTAYQYKFKNGPDGWESIDQSIGGPCTVGGFGDREVNVGDSDIELDVVCFGYCVTCNFVSTDEAALKAGVRVFPNPAKELLNVNIDLPEAASSLSVRMYNAVGQIVSQRYLGQFQTGNIELDVRHLPSGAYLIQVMDGKAQFTQTVIIE